MPARRQIAAALHPDDHALLKKLAGERRESYAEVIAAGLRALADTSRTLVVYATLAPEQRAPWRAKIRALAASGLSPAAVGKRLFLEDGLAGMDGLPLGASTVRSALAMRTPPVDKSSYPQA